MWIFPSEENVKEKGYWTTKGWSLDIIEFQASESPWSLAWPQRQWRIFDWGGIEPIMIELVIGRSLGFLPRRERKIHIQCLESDSNFYLKSLSWSGILFWITGNLVRNVRSLSSSAWHEHSDIQENSVISSIITFSRPFSQKIPRQIVLLSEMLPLIGIGLNSFQRRFTEACSFVSNSVSIALEYREWAASTPIKTVSEQECDWYSSIAVLWTQSVSDDDQMRNWKFRCSSTWCRLQMMLKSWQITRHHIKDQFCECTRYLTRIPSQTK
jgi:hypothetical protein